MQLRALDWDVDIGIQDYPVVTIYHPRDPKLGHAFANVAWTGTNISIALLIVQIKNYSFVLRLYWNINWYVICTNGYFRNWCFIS